MFLLLAWGLSSIPLPDRLIELTYLRVLGRAAVWRV